MATWFTELVYILQKVVKSRGPCGAIGLARMTLTLFRISWLSMTPAS
jgi:hypothetical protein